MIIDLKKEFYNLNMNIKGVIHIGAGEGEDYQIYKDLNIGNMIFVEANPRIFPTLRKNIPENESVFLYNYAVSDENKIGEFHITDFSQSSSLLPLKGHKKIYPEIHETEIIKVECKTLDSIMESHDLKNFNFINIDVQGAELLVFSGGTKTLLNIDVINTEVNFEELYEKCALVQDLDYFLGKLGFKRIITKTPYHPSWGDSLYVNNHRLSRKFGES